MLLLSALLLILLSKISLRILYFEKAFIIISFLCFDIYLYDFKKERKRKLALSARNIKNLLRLINNTLSKTEIQINKLFLPDISDIQALNGLKASLLSIFIAYISARSVKIKADEHFMRKEDFDKAEIDLTIRGRILPIGITMLSSYLKNNS